MSDRPVRRRSGAEWSTFAVSLAVLLVLVGLMVAQLGDRDDPPVPIVTILDESITRTSGGFQVPVEVRNEGGQAATNVQVLAELVTARGTESSDQTIDVLGADERDRLVFVFADDPAGGDLSVVVGGFAEP